MTGARRGSETVTCRAGEHRDQGSRVAARAEGGHGPVPQGCPQVQREAGMQPRLSFCRAQFLSNGNDRSAKGPSAWKTPAPHSNPHGGLPGPRGKIISRRGPRGLRATGTLGGPFPALTLPDAWPLLAPSGRPHRVLLGEGPRHPATKLHTCAHCTIPGLSLGQRKTRPGHCFRLNSTPSL